MNRNSRFRKPVLYPFELRGRAEIRLACGALGGKRWVGVRSWIAETWDDAPEIPFGSAQGRLSLRLKNGSARDDAARGETVLTVSRADLR